ncbi:MULTISPECIES: leucine efflux protein LeuE [Streptomyces]|uniref:Leucine efflux protein LeuE n=1 Tax=Streptomyces eurythermus TaxID=42237 RepID=A0ABW6YR07_9ACTN|nr:MULTISPECIES: leucine efflux protein LeuE [Streptomyces]QIS74698.1 leucine efflux protein LeuE [Streptomyces sp. DSM 40868]WDM10727.1 leucine efflux protein LeuE [Streptomyces lavenduligriseus]
MLGVTNLPTYTLGALLIILLPGPSSLYTLSVASRRGVRTGYRAAAGMFIGECLLMLLTSAGLASLLKANQVVFSVVKFAGAGYLVWIAIGMIRAAVAVWRNRSTQRPAPDGEPAKAEHPFRRSLLITLLNPKAILFFLSFFVQFVDPSYPHPALSFGLLALVYQAISITYISVLILGGTYLAAQFRRHRRLSAGLTVGSGALFLGFAAKLATAGG